MARTETAVQPGSGLDRFFKISERGSTVRTELIAGAATWLTMAYILFLNPAILGSVADPTGASLPFPAVLTVTALVAGVMTIAMGVYANVPFALAAGLGLNGFVAFTLVAQLGLTWPQAMGVIVVEGLIIAVLVLTGFRSAVMEAIPTDLKRAIGIGIGLFLMIIGLVNAGIVVNSDATLITLTDDFRSLPMLVFVFGFALASIFVVRKVRGGLLISILASTVLAIAINEVWGDGLIWGDTGIATIPSDVVSTPDFSLVGDFSFSFFSALGFVSALVPVFAVMLSDFFDTMGTAVGLGEEAGLLDEEGKLPAMNRVLFVDSVAAAAGGAASSSSNTTFIESAAGIGEGGRTGLTAVTVGGLFLLCLFISPLAGIVPPEATAPVLVIVGYFMMQSVGEIDWRDPSIGIPALLTIGLMPFTYSITNGIGAGFIAYTAIRVMQGRWRDVHPLMYVVTAGFLFYFIRGVLA
ncbi:MAG: NCS2 family permease [Actinomycetota bacterium]|nr:NCS2 family permease [Actinomycetota bacterium]